jgi:hypothetical protein
MDPSRLSLQDSSFSESSGQPQYTVPSIVSEPSELSSEPTDVRPPNPIRKDPGLPALPRHRQPVYFITFHVTAIERTTPKNPILRFDAKVWAPYVPFGFKLIFRLTFPAFDRPWCAKFDGRTMNSSSYTIILSTPIPNVLCLRFLRRSPPPEQERKKTNKE